jgi:hypothetical protein
MVKRSKVGTKNREKEEGGEREREREGCSMDLKELANCST